MTVDEFWQKFLKDSNKRPDLKYNGEFQLGEGTENICELTALVLAGKKTAACSSLYSFDIDMMRRPEKNDYYIITDAGDNPVCVIRNTNVTVLSLNNVTWEMAVKEGDCNSIEEWRENHIEFFREEADIMGYDFSEDMPVVFEEFEVIYKG
ncbi:MAG: ASCH domain-containing protein [Treponema sp.]